MLALTSSTPAQESAQHLGGHHSDPMEGAAVYPRTAIVDHVAVAVPPAGGQPDVRGEVPAATVPW